MEKGVTYRYGQKKETVWSSMKDKLGTTTLNHVVARYKNGKIVKGSTYNFNPQRKVFHIVPKEKDAEKIFEISFSELKAVFFVKSLEGKRDHPPVKDGFEEEAKAGAVRIVRVTFLDGETLMGMTHAYDPERKGFFIHPLDEEDNNSRTFVLSDAIKYLEISQIGS